jgi:quercetin dioxygenase-like cupin family protein
MAMVASAQVSGHSPLAKSHVYLKTHQVSGRRLHFGLAREDVTLRAQAASSTTGRAGKTLVKQGSMRITQIALRKGSRLGSHQVTGALSLQMLRGRMRLTTSDGELFIGWGELVALGPGVHHDAEATSDCVVLVTLAMPEAKLGMPKELE